jgi:hypothetical protein
VVAEGLIATGRALGADLAERLSVICRRAGDPPTVVVTGKVSSGKSTLVNALVRRRVAPTDAGECTQVVSRFRFGRVEQVLVHTRSGEARSVRFDAHGRIPSRLEVPTSEIDHLEVFLAVKELRAVELVDTPGVSATSSAAARTEAFVGFDEASRTEVGRADAVVYLLTQTGRSDEAADLAAFGAAAGGRSDAAIGVLAKADLVHGGDPQAAAKLAEGLAKQLSGSLSTVLPVWTLVAETIACGRLREADAATLAAVADLNCATRDLLLGGADLFCDEPAPVPADHRRRLEDLLAHAGVRHAVRAAAGGVRGAAQLANALDAVSGRHALEAAITRLGERADVLRASRMLSDAEKLAFDTMPEGQPLHDAVEKLRARHELHRLDETSALDDIEFGRVRFSPSDTARALAVLTRQVPAGLDLDAAIDHWRAVENTTLDLDAQRAATTIARSLGLHRETT